MFAASPAMLSPAILIPEAQAVYSALVAWWDFEENNAGAQFNDSHGSNHMVILPTLPTSALGGAATVGRGFKPGSNTGYVAIVPYANTNLRFPNSNFSFGGWTAGFNAAGGWTGFVGGRLGSAAGMFQAYISIESIGSNYQFAASSDGTSQTTILSGLFADSPTPTFVVATFDRTNNLIRIRTRKPSTANTNQTAAFPSALFTGVTTANFCLNGGASDDNTLFPGSRSLNGVPQFDSWFYCLKALSDAEVDYLYNLGAGKNYAALAADSGH